MESVSLRLYLDAYSCHRVQTVLMYDGYIHIYWPRPPGRIPAMLMNKFPQHVTSAGLCFEFGFATCLVILATPLGIKRQLWTGRVALVSMLTDAARLQSALDPKTGSRILPNGSRSQIQNTIPLRSRVAGISSLTWHVYGPGSGPTTMDKAVVH